MNLLSSTTVAGRTFVLRSRPGVFAFEVSEVRAGIYSAHSSYRLRALADAELAKRVSWAAEGWHSFDAIQAELRERNGPVDEHPLSGYERYRAENPMVPSCMPDHH